MIWASGEIITTTPHPETKLSKHGYLNKIKPKPEASQAPRRCRASKEEQAKHQGGAGQARRSRPSTKEVQGKPPGEEQDKFQEHLIKLNQKHQQQS
jgi:hypothetical protein